MTFAQSGFAMLVRLIAGARLSVDAGYAGYAEAGHATVLDLPRQALFFANHSSHLDFATIWSVLPGSLRRRTRPVAAADYWGAGLRGRFADGMFRPVLVSRQHQRQHDESATRPASGGDTPPATSTRGLRGQLKALGAALEAGESLILFPEGTRGDGVELAEFKPGLAKLARAFPEVPVIPVALANLGRILPKGSLVPVPILGSASFLAPIAPGTDEDDAEFLARARATLITALPRADDEGETELDSEARSAS